MAQALVRNIETTSPFEAYLQQAFPFRYEGILVVRNIAGGTPSDPRVIEGWLRAKLGDKDDLIREEVARTMAERNLGIEEATREVERSRNLNGFRRNEEGILFIEGRQLKACIKEAANAAVGSGKLNGKGWGHTKKGLHGFIAEHVFVPEDRLYLHRMVQEELTPVTEPDSVVQRFISTWKGNGIQYEECVETAFIPFTVITDWQFSDEEWAMIWLTAEQEGLGASRSQGYGRFKVAHWQQV